MDISLENIPTKELEAELTKRRSIEAKVMATTPPRMAEGRMVFKPLFDLLREAIKLIAMKEEDGITDDMAHIIAMQTFDCVYGPEFNEWYKKTAKVMQE